MKLWKHISLELKLNLPTSVSHESNRIGGNREDAYDGKTGIFWTKHKIHISFGFAFAMVMQMLPNPRNCIPIQCNSPFLIYMQSHAMMTKHMKNRFKKKSYWGKYTRSWRTCQIGQSYNVSLVKRLVRTGMAQKTNQQSWISKWLKFFKFSSRHASIFLVVLVD